MYICIRYLVASYILRSSLYTSTLYTYVYRHAEYLIFVFEDITSRIFRKVDAIIHDKKLELVKFGIFRIRGIFAWIAVKYHPLDRLSVNIVSKYHICTCMYWYIHMYIFFYSDIDSRVIFFFFSKL